MKTEEDYKDKVDNVGALVVELLHLTLLVFILFPSSAKKRSNDLRL